MAGLVTLTTDFGAGSSYVAAMKGVLYTIHKSVVLVDLTHQVPPQDLHYTAYFLQAAVPYFPPDTLHVVVVDPGVGSERGILYVELVEQRLLVPDNGCWTTLIDPANPPRRVLRLTESRYWRPQVSSTFHGRDIFAPAAAHLSLGVDPNQLGVPVDSWTMLHLPQPQLTDTILSGEVVFIDDFGNLLTNISGEAFERWRDRPVRIYLGDHEIQRRGRTYADVEPATALALVSSRNTLEIAVRQGNAARRFQVGAGTSVRVALVSTG
jgi:S-adenosylmethionine hydrolase